MSYILLYVCYTPYAQDKKPSFCWLGRRFLKICLISFVKVLFVGGRAFPTSELYVSDVGNEHFRHRKRTFTTSETYASDVGSVRFRRRKRPLPTTETSVSERTRSSPALISKKKKCFTNSSHCIPKKKCLKTTVR